MSAGSPRVANTDMLKLTRAQADRIARLFAEGQPAGRIALIARCTRARVQAVADAHGWQLDAAGVLPRQQRPAVVPGQPVPAASAGMGPAPARTPLPRIPNVPPARSQRVTPAPQRPQCSIPGCEDDVRTVGLCSKHYMRKRRAS